MSKPWSMIYPPVSHSSYWLTGIPVAADQGVKVVSTLLNWLHLLTWDSYRANDFRQISHIWSDGYRHHSVCQLIPGWNTIRLDNNCRYIQIDDYKVWFYYSIIRACSIGSVCITVCLGFFTLLGETQLAALLNTLYSNHWFSLGLVTVN